MCRELGEILISRVLFVTIKRLFIENLRLERYTNWDIGLNMETLNAYYYTAISQQEAEEQQSEVG